MWHYLCDPKFSRYDTIPVCDGQTQMDRQRHRERDRQTHNTGIHRASIVLHGKSWSTLVELIWQKIKYTTFSWTRYIRQSKWKKIKPSLVAFYDIQPWNGAGPIPTTQTTNGRSQSQYNTTIIQNILSPVHLSYCLFICKQTAEKQTQYGTK